MPCAMKSAGTVPRQQPVRHQEQLDGKVVEWMEKVSEEQYQGFTDYQATVLNIHSSRRWNNRKTLDSRLCHSGYPGIIVSAYRCVDAFVLLPNRIFRAASLFAR